MIKAAKDHYVAHCLQSISDALLTSVLRVLLVSSAKSRMWD